MSTFIDTPSPVFILSCERSGSTLLRMIVDTHSDVACPGQLYLGPTCENLYKMIYYTLGQRLVGSESERRELVLREVRAMVGGVMERYASARGKRIWCEKTTLNADFIAILSDVFPTARYLCLYRNCMDVVQSCLAFNSFGFMPELAPYVGRQPESLVGAMVENWLDRNRKILDFESERKDRCLRVSYESLTSEAETILPSIFRFLGVGWEPRILDTIFSCEHDRGEGDLKVHFFKEIKRDSIGTGRRIPLTEVPDALRPRIDGMNTELGYPPLEVYYADQEGVGSNASQAERAELDAFFGERAPQIISDRRSVVGNLHSVCRLVMEGADDESWTIDLSGADGVIHAGEGGSPADCTITVARPAFLGLIRGTTSVTDLLECNQIGVRGSAHLALQFGILLFN